MAHAKAAAYKGANLIRDYAVTSELYLHKLSEMSAHEDLHL